MTVNVTFFVNKIVNALSLNFFSVYLKKNTKKEGTIIFLCASDYSNQTNNYIHAMQTVYLKF